MIAAIGLQSAGGVLVPLNTRLKGGEAGYILKKSRARILCAVGEFLGNRYVDLLRRRLRRSQPMRVRWPSCLTSNRWCCLSSAVHPLCRVPFRGRFGISAAEFIPRWREVVGRLPRSRCASVPTDEAKRRAAAVAPDDLSDILFTSGTTGQPKGVMTTHGQNLRVFRAWSDVVGLRAGDRYLIVNPFFHSFGYKAGWLSALMCGATDPAAGRCSMSRRRARTHRHATA